MQKTTSLYEIIYVSTLALHAPISSVGEIAGKSRAANRRRDITGLLIFDGSRFCQQLEGPRREVIRLLDHIRMDARHTDVEVIYDGELNERRFQNFGLGYCPTEADDALAHLEKLDGQAAPAMC